MSTEDLRRAHTRLLDAVLVGRDPEALLRGLDKAHALHTSLWPDLPPGRGPTRFAVERLQKVFGRALVHVHDQVAAGDRCFTRLTYYARHTGPLGASRASGRWVGLRAHVITRFEGGLARETWVETNDVEALRYLGALRVTGMSEHDADLRGVVDEGGA